MENENPLIWRLFIIIEPVKSSNSLTYPRVPLFARQVFFVSGLVAYGLDALLSLILLAQVYDKGLRFSPFLVQTLTQIVLPPILFGTAFLLIKQKTHSRRPLFLPGLLALIGVWTSGALYLLYQVGISRLFAPVDVAQAAFQSALPVLVCLLGFLPLMLWLRRKDNLDGLMARIFLLAAGTVYAINTAANFYFLRQVRGLELNIITLLAVPAVIATLLPPIFWLMAWIILPKSYPKADHTLLATVYTASGLMMTNAFLSVASIGSRIFPTAALLTHAPTFTLAFAASGFALYLFLVLQKPLPSSAQL